jgi:GNAT superfamily N-acetyltransferase
MDAQVRVAKEEDAEAACEVLRRSITECCSEDHEDNPSQLALWLENKTPENVRRWIRDPGSYAIVAEANGDIIGVAMMFESGEVTLCYLAPEALFTGVGKALLAGLVSRAHALGLHELQLNSTKTAHAFYLRNGFADAGSPTTWRGIACIPMVKALGER